jgi:trimeric autotransporter adhesin
MKKGTNNLWFLLLFLTAGLISQTLYSQLTGIKTIPGDYATISAAITDLNTAGVGTGGVTFNIAAGYTETAANLTITATGTPTNPIVFQKIGAALNPLITADVGVSTTLDGIIKLSGTDYITFDGIDLQENAANTTTTTQMEWGFALLKADATNGCRYVTIKNCTVTLIKTNLNTVGIYSANHTTASTAGLVIADTLGTNSYNKFYSNVISNVNSGIAITGYASATPYTFYDQNNEVGTTGTRQNRIYNYASTTTAYGVYGIYQNNIKIFNTNINNSGGAASTSTLYGIFLSTGVNSNVDIYGDTVTVVSGGTTTQQAGIYNSMGATGTTNTVNMYNNVVHNCSYTTATSGVAYYIYQGAGCYNMNLYGNKVINNTYGGTATATGSNYFIYTLGGTTTSNIWQIYNNEISNNVRTQTTLGSGLSYFLYNSGSGPTMNFYGNILKDNVFPSTSTSYGMYLSGSAMTTMNMYNNTIKNMTRPNLSSGGFYCIYHAGGASGGTANIYNNSISDVTISGSGTIYGLYSSASMNKNIYQDTIYNLNTNGGSIYGIYSLTGLTTEAYRNKVTGLYTTAGTVYGAYFTSGTTNYFHNNFISDLKATTAAGAISIAGLYFSGGTNNYVFYNSIYLNAVSSSAATFGTAGIYVSTTPTVDLRNNIVVNVSTPGPTGGFTTAYFRNSATLTTYAAASNNNVLYAGTPAPNRLIYNDGTNQLQLMEAFKTLVAPRDNNSFTENPPFINVSTAPFDLHISTVLPTGIEGSGVPITTPIVINTDYDNQSRHATNPDIGADEGTFIFGDLVPPSIAYTPLWHTSSTGNRIITATITDNNALQNTPPNDPRLYYKKGVNGTYVYKNKTSQTGNDFTFTMDMVSIGGLVMGDTLFYYIAAQDLGTPPNPPNCGTNPAGGSGVNPPGTTAPANANWYIVVDQPLTGVYTVGLTLFNKASGRNLVSVKKTRYVDKVIPVENDLFDHKNEKNPGAVDNVTGVSDKKTETRIIQVLEEYYELTENGVPYTSFDKVDLSKDDLMRLGYTGMGTDDPRGIYPTITAALSDMKNRSIQGPVTFLLVDADYPNEVYPLQINSVLGTSATNTITIKPSAGVTATISGSQVSGGLFRILNTNYVIIDGSNTAGGTTRDLSIFNNATTGPSVVHVGSLGTTPITNVTVKNCNIRNGINTSSAVVVSDGNALGTAGYYSNITIQNNLIQRAYMGVYCQGGTIPQNGSNLSLIGNSLDSTGIYSIRYIGLYMQGVNGATISGNTIGNFDGATSEDDKGMWLATGSTNINVEKNKIYNMGYTGTSGYGAHGIYITSTLTDAGINVRNNMISNLTGDGYNYTSIPLDNVIGIVLPSAQTGINIFYNSIHLSGNTLNQTSAMSMGIYLGLGAVADIRANIIVNNLGLLAAIGYGSAGIYAVTSNAQFFGLDYNDYYINPTGSGLKLFGQIASTGSTTLEDWKTATGKDAYSVEGDPQFISLNDLHINTGVPTIVEGRCVPTGGVTFDFDGDTRNATTPDIGADEGNFMAIVLPPAPPALLLPVNGAVNQSLTPLMDWNTSATATSYKIQISIDPGFASTVLDSSGIAGTEITVPSGILVGDSLYYWRVNATNTGGEGSYSAVWNFRTAAQVANVNLTVIPGGFYNTGTGMLNMKDTINVYLVDSVSCQRVDSAKGVIDSLTYSMTISFSNAETGNYYLMIYHRNHLAVASRYKQNVVRGSTVGYDFTTDSSKAFGFNMVKVSTSPVRWAMISGDANKDGFVDGLDQTIWLAQNGFDGYLPADFNGDSFVDGLDQTIWLLYNGNSSFLPCGFFLDPVTGIIQITTPNYDARKGNMDIIDKKRNELPKINDQNRK